MILGRRKKKPKRRGYVRPSRAKPKPGWSVRQLAGLSGTPVRTVRFYLERGVLPRPVFKGSATRYQRRELVWLLAIRRLRAAERLPLAEIRTRLLALPAPELEAFATEGLPPGALANALAAAPAPGTETARTKATAATATTAPHTAPRVAPTAVAATVPRWARLELALGLELHIRDDASPSVIELARQLHDLCASGPGAEGASAGGRSRAR